MPPKPYKKMKLTKEQAQEKYPHATFYGDCWISEDAIIDEGAIVREDATIGRGAIIRSSADIGAGAVIYPGAEIRHGAVIGTGAVISKSAIIGRSRKNVKHARLFHAGNTGLTLHDSDDGLVFVCGCFNAYKGGTEEEFRNAVTAKYPDKKHPIRRAYHYAIEAGKAQFKYFNQSKTKMTTENAIKILREYNAWRRGDESIDMDDPVKIGEAIETAISSLELFLDQGG